MKPARSFAREPCFHCVTLGARAFSEMNKVAFDGARGIQPGRLVTIYPNSTVPAARRRLGRGAPSVEMCFCSKRATDSVLL